MSVVVAEARLSRPAASEELALAPSSRCSVGGEDAEASSAVHGSSPPDLTDVVERRAACSGWYIYIAYTLRSMVFTTPIESAADGWNDTAKNHAVLHAHGPGGERGRREGCQR